VSEGGGEGKGEGESRSDCERREEGGLGMGEVKMDMR